jgi:RNA polymerase sigma-70 factor (ECF subfamily)
LDDLMVRALNGDGAAYAEALRQMTLLAHKILSTRNLSPETKEDVVQDILLSVHQARHTWDGNRPFKPWFYAIARYRTADALRHLYRNREDTLTDPQEWLDFAAPVTESHTKTEELKNALNKLPVRDREIVTQMKIYGRSAHEVATRLNMTVTAVKVAAHRAYKKLRSEMEKHHG